MDFASSLFPYVQNDELFQFSSIPFQHNHPIFQQDSLLVTTTSLSNSGEPEDGGRRQKSSLAFDDNNIDENPSDHKRRKMIHRDIERQRRREMAVLHRSLKSTLPPEYIKGKRSISDHVHESVNYIRHLQKRAEKLSEKRDGLKRLPNKSTANDDGSKVFPSTSRKDISVTIETSGERVRIILRGGWSLSKALDVLIQEGLTITSCISTNVNERLLHTIESEVSDGKSINPSEMQKKLEDLMA
ncbi:Transcription factor bHLH125 like [Actinidia chinensis var. chinensis]|uniref:Transcription factor bHLH125 like n=1 Tax=Actinidia chinensis var. chinensis TaxID=1590841 RepID=A0A2R6QNJ4_ACTCC|nr:Transcription factor bHLH125 like [Actinidia chinensis var. chinensis]